MSFLTPNTLPAIDFTLETVINRALKQQFYLPGLNKFNIANTPLRLYHKGYTVKNVVQCYIIPLHSKQFCQMIARNLTSSLFHFLTAFMRMTEFDKETQQHCHNTGNRWTFYTKIFKQHILSLLAFFPFSSKVNSSQSTLLLTTLPPSQAKRRRVSKQETGPSVSPRGHRASPRVPGGGPSG